MSIIRSHMHTQVLLGTADATRNHRMVSDFLALHELLASYMDNNVKWVYPPDLQLDEFPRRIHDLTEDPAYANAISSCSTFPTAYPESKLWLVRLEFILNMRKMARSSSPDDVLFIVLIGDYDHNGSFLIDSDMRTIISASNIEHNIEEHQGPVVLLNPYCDPEKWKSPRWTLLVAADADIGPALREHRCDRGVLVDALIAQQTNEGRSTSNNLALTDESLNIGEALVQCVTRMTPDSDSDSHSLPPLLSPFLRCIPPSARKLRFPPTPLSEDEAAELRSLCAAYAALPLPHWGAETGMSYDCTAYPRGELDGKFTYIRWLLDTLRGRHERNMRAVQIAKGLGWNVEQHPHPSQLEVPQPTSCRALRARAEDAGCRVSALEMKWCYRWWVGAADWLANVWEAEGCPVVEEADWERVSDFDWAVPFDVHMQL